MKTISGAFDSDEVMSRLIYTRSQVVKRIYHLGIAEGYAEGMDVDKDALVCIWGVVPHFCDLKSVDLVWEDVRAPLSGHGLLDSCNTVTRLPWPLASHCGDFSKVITRALVSQRESFKRSPDADRHLRFNYTLRPQHIEGYAGLTDGASEEELSRAALLYADR